METAGRICKELVNLLKEKQEDTRDPKYSNIFGSEGNPNNLYIYINDKVNERISSSLAI